MAAAAAAGGGPGNASDDFLRVYRAVSSGASEQELRHGIDECARGDDRRRARAVNEPGQKNETPLQAAHRQKRGDLVGALVEAGADVGGIVFGLFSHKLTPLAVCIAYGQVESVRTLLRAGHDVQEKIEWGPHSGTSCTAAHFCLAPPPLGLPSDWVVGNTILGAPQIGCLEVLLREGGADVNARDSRGEAPIFWLAQYGSHYDDEEEKAARDLLVSAGAHTSGVFSDDGFSPLMVAALYKNTRLGRCLIEEAGVPVDERSPCGGQTALRKSSYAGAKMAALLLDAGADVDARDDDGETALYATVTFCNIAATRLLLERGASVEVIGPSDRSLLLAACENSYTWLHDEGWPLVQAILRRSSAETRRRLRDGIISAVDVLALFLNWHVRPFDEVALRVQKRCCWAISELLASGAPVLPENADRVLPIAAPLSARLEAELAALLAELASWRAHETFVGVSLDFGELRGAESEVGEKRARLAALERELEELGESGSSSSSGDGDDDDDESTSEGEGETEGDAESECEGGTEEGGEQSEGRGGAATGERGSVGGK